MTSLQVYKTINVFPNSFRGKKKKKKTHLSTTQLDILAHTPTPDNHSSRTAVMFVLFIHPRSIYNSCTLFLYLKTTHLIITPGKT